MNRLIAILVAVLLATAVAPARAHEQGGPPELAPLRSVRDRFVQVFDGRPLQVCRSDWESWNRVHGTCHQLASVELAGTTLVAGRVVEFVYYDGTRYERVDGAATWRATADAQFDPDMTLDAALFRVAYDATLTRIGPAEVDGRPTLQYQYWMHVPTLNEPIDGQAVYDLFVAADGYVVKSQFSSRGSIAGLGRGELAEVWAYSDFNTPIVVAPPPADLVVTS